MSDKIAALEPLVQYDTIAGVTSAERKGMRRVLDVLGVEMLRASQNTPSARDNAVAGIILAPVNASGRAMTSEDDEFLTLTMRLDLRNAQARVADFITLDTRNHLIASAAEAMIERQPQRYLHFATFYAYGVDDQPLSDLAGGVVSGLMSAWAVIGQRQCAALSVTADGFPYAASSSIRNESSVRHDPTSNQFTPDMTTPLSQRSMFDQVRALDEFMAAAPIIAEGFVAD